MNKLSYFFCALFFLTSISFAQKYQYQETSFPSYDGTKISANCFIPVSEKQDQVFPAIIFANSWTADEHQYKVQAKLFAEKGYIVFSYSSRGWGESEGMVTVAGPKDMKDVSVCLDWLMENTPIDQKNIGVSGISYGSGMALLALAHDSRLKTAVAMSTWGNLATSLYGNETPHFVWSTILLGSGYLTGNMHPMIWENYENLLLHRDIEKTMVWTAKRSPSSFIEQINARQTPIYISNNLQDEMFAPNAVVDFFSRLTVPKRLDLNIGIHASAELGGLIGEKNYVWEKAHAWFDYWLKGQKNGIMQEKPVHMVVKNKNIRESFPAWPIPSLRGKTYYLGERPFWEQGTLSEEPSLENKANKISSSTFSGLNTGIPVIGAIFEAYTPIKIQTWFPLTDRSSSLVYLSSKLESTLRLRGAGKLNLWVQSKAQKIQLIAHLYDVDESGTGTLITHGPVTLYDLKPNEPREVKFDLVTTSYDIPKGHRLGLGIDTYDLNYAAPSMDYYDIQFFYGEKCPSQMLLPTIEEASPNKIGISRTPTSSLK